MKKGLIFWMGLFLFSANVSGQKVDTLRLLTRKAWTRKADHMVIIDSTQNYPTLPFDFSRLTAINYASVYGSQFKLNRRDNGGYFKIFGPQCDKKLNSIPLASRYVKQNQKNKDESDRILSDKRFLGIPRYDKRYFYKSDSFYWEYHKDTLTIRSSVPDFLGERRTDTTVKVILDITKRYMVTYTHSHGNTFWVTYWVAGNRKTLPLELRHRYMLLNYIGMLAERKLVNIYLK